MKYSLAKAALKNDRRRYGGTKGGYAVRSKASVRASGQAERRPGSAKSLDG